MTTATPIETTDLRTEMLEEGFDLPELADTMEEADARATASTYLYALKSVKRQLDANDAEFTVLQEYNRTRHIERQGVLIRQTDYLRNVLEGLFGFMHTGKKKSLNLLGGRVGMRAQQPELSVEDDAVVIQWADDHGVEALVRMKKSIDRTGLRKHLQEQTDPPPGVTLNARPDVFFATPAD